MRSNNIRKAIFKVVWILPITAALVCVSVAAEAATLTVGTCPKSAFSTIQSAVNAANAGDTIDVCPGSYPGQVLISKSLTVVGILNGNLDAAVILPPAGGLLPNAVDPISGVSEAAQVLVQTPTGVNGSISVTLHNLTVDGTNNGISACTPMVTGILYQNASGKVSEVAVRNQTLAAALNLCQSGSAIRVESSEQFSSVASVTVQNSTVHDYQKNGITGLGSDTSISVLSNFVRGQGATTGAAENGIQVSDGASGKVRNNNVIDHISVGTGFAASGIIIFGSSNVQVTGNTVGNNQFGVAVASTTTAKADSTVIKNNTIFGTREIDGIDLCSNSNVVTNNTIASSDESGVDLDSSCDTTGNNNTVTHNTINEACAGILAGTGTSGNTTTPNTFFNVTNIILSGDVCPAATAGSAQAQLQSDSGRPALAPAD